MPSACVPREGTAVVQTQSARVCTKRWLPHSTRCGCEPPITSSRKHRVDSCIKAGCYRGSDGAAPSSSRTARSQPAYTSGTSPPHTCAAIFPANTPSTPWVTNSNQSIDRQQRCSCRKISRCKTRSDRKDPSSLKDPSNHLTQKSLKIPPQPLPIPPSSEQLTEHLLSLDLGFNVLNDQLLRESS